MDLIQTSRSLTEENASLENFMKRLEEYMFSSKIRSLVFGYEIGKEREQIISDLILKLKTIFDNLKRLSSDIEIYYKEIKHSKIFIQKKHFIFAKKFVYNALVNITLIEGSIKKIIQKLELIKDNQKENQSIFHFIRKEFSSILKHFNENKVLLSDIQGRLQVENNLLSEYKEIKRYLIDKSTLNTGDILISFKSKDYLKNFLISRTISKVTDSQVTHVMLAAKVSPSNIKIIDSSGKTGGVHLREFEIVPGEVFIVLRPRISHYQKGLLMSRIKEHIKNKTGFSRSKLKGVLPTFLIGKMINMFSLGYKHTPNLVAVKQAEFFCSEFINLIFKEVGILLTPKSKYSDMVFPSDVVVSPFVDYIGLIFEDSERSEKIIRKYLGNIKI